jgi:hypothetical protein
MPLFDAKLMQLEKSLNKIFYGGEDDDDVLGFGAM